MSKGYIQAAFQARHGITVAEWLLQHGSQYTLRQAAEFIGYECTSSLSGFRTWLDKHAPDIQFRQPDRRKNREKNAVRKARSPIIAAFEARTGQKAVAWLAERKGGMTLKAAAFEIGYSKPEHLTSWMRRNMPGFRFTTSRAGGFTDDDLRAAIQMVADGATWNAVAKAYSCHRQTLWAACRQYQKRTKPA